MRLQEYYPNLDNWNTTFTLVGGGHTVVALQEFGLSDKISYISTAGEALIEFLMGKNLPGVVALEKAATRKPCPSYFCV